MCLLRQKMESNHGAMGVFRFDADKILIMGKHAKGADLAPMCFKITQKQRT